MTYFHEIIKVQIEGYSAQARRTRKTKPALSTALEKSREDEKAS